MRAFVISIIAAAALAAAGVKAEARPLAHDCAGFITDSPGAPSGVTIGRGRPSCRTAKSVLRRYLYSHAGCSGSGCYQRVRGWDCVAVPARRTTRGWPVATAVIA
jgi:hypothetical protein